MTFWKEIITLTHPIRGGGYEIFHTNFTSTYDFYHYHVLPISLRTPRRQRNMDNKSPLTKKSIVRYSDPRCIAKNLPRMDGSNLTFPRLVASATLTSSIPRFFFKVDSIR